METAFESSYFAVEDRHWWFRARRDMIRRLLSRHRLGTQAKILDVGCAGGALIRNLHGAGYADVAGIDISDRAVARCRSLGLDQVSRADAARLQFGDAEFDAVIASDILEHLPDERQALAEWRRVLKPNGLLLVFVPAFRFLWSRRDDANHHYRRYQRATLDAAVIGAGFTKERSSYWNCALFGPVAAVLTLSRLMPTAPGDVILRLPPRPLNAALERLLMVENRLLARLDAPLGVSVFFMGTKR